MEIFLLALLTFLAAAIGTITGFGTSTIMMPIMIMILPLPEALLFVGIIHWAGNIWRIFLFKDKFLWKIILGFAIPGLIFSWLGAMLAVKIPKETLAPVMGVFLMLYVLYLFKNPNFKLRPGNLIAALGGITSGFAAGIFGVGGSFRSAFLSTFKLPKHLFIFTSAMIALVIDSARLITYFSSGTIVPPPLSYGLLLFIPISYIGARFAKHLVKFIPEKHFRTVVAVFIFLAGMKLLF